MKPQSLRLTSLPEKLQAEKMRLPLGNLPNLPKPLQVGAFPLGSSLHTQTHCKGTAKIAPDPKAPPKLTAWLRLTRPGRPRQRRFLGPRGRVEAPGADLPEVLAQWNYGIYVHHKKERGVTVTLSPNCRWQLICVLEHL